MMTSQPTRAPRRGTATLRGDPPRSALLRSDPPRPAPPRGLARSDPPHFDPPRPGLARALAAALLAACAACTSLNPFDDEDTTRVTQEELRANVTDLVQRFIEEVGWAASAIFTSSEDPGVKRYALAWRLYNAHVCRRSLDLEPPQAALIDVWTFAGQAHAFFERGEGAGVFGEHQGLALDTVAAMGREAEELAGDLLDPDAFAAARAAVDEFVEGHPLESISGRAVHRTSPQTTGWSPPFAAVLSLPLAPFRALEGIDEGAHAIREFASVADRFTGLVEDLPRQTAWQLELLLFDATREGRLGDAVGAFTEAADATAAAARTVSELPDELGAQLPELRRTLDELGTTISRLESAMVEAQALSDGITGIASEVTRAGDAWAGTARAFGITPTGAEEQDGGEGKDEDEFDITEYGEAGRDVARAAIELQTLVHDVEAMLASEDVARLETVVQGATGEARDLVDHVAWRLVQVLGALFLLLLLYRAVVRLLPNGWRDRQHAHVHRGAH